MNGTFLQGIVESQWESWAQPGEGRSVQLISCSPCEFWSPPIWNPCLEASPEIPCFPVVIQPGENSSLHHWVISPSLRFFFLSSGKFFRPWDPSKHVKFCESQVWPCLFRDHHSVELYLLIYHRVVSFPHFSGPGVGWADDRVGCPELMASPIFTSSFTLVLT